MKIRDIAKLFDARYPTRSAESWDNVGLLVGEMDAETHHILLCLEVTDAIIDEAIQKHCDLIISHHPLIFKPLAKVSSEDPISARVIRLIRNNIALYSAHTNCDAAPDAIGDFLANKIGIADNQPLDVKPFNKGYKLIVYIPRTDTDRVLGALHQAGAGTQGNYTNVSFRGQGKGCFTPSDGAHPAIGTPGQPETVDEDRVELLVDELHLNAVLRALEKTHPYEEPAFDLYELKNPSIHGITHRHGFGTIGNLPHPVKLRELIQIIKSEWQIDSLRFAGNPEQDVRRIAILNGSGAKFMDIAQSRGADVYITGDCGHHDFERANTCHFNLIEAGHFHTEKFIPQLFAELLRKNTQPSDIQFELSEYIHCPYINL